MDINEEIVMLPADDNLSDQEIIDKYKRGELSPMQRFPDLNAMNSIGFNVYPTNTLTDFQDTSVEQQIADQPKVDQLKKMQKNSDMNIVNINNKMILEPGVYLDDKGQVYSISEDGTIDPIDF